MEQINEKNWFSELRQNKPYLIPIIYQIRQQLGNMFALMLTAESIKEIKVDSYLIQLRLVQSSEKNIQFDIKIQKSNQIIDFFRLVFDSFILSNSDKANSFLKSIIDQSNVKDTTLIQIIQDSKITIMNLIKKKESIDQVELLDLIPSDRNFIPSIELFDHVKINQLNYPINFYLLYYNLVDLSLWNKEWLKHYFKAGTFDFSIINNKEITTIGLLTQMTQILNEPIFSRLQEGVQNRNESIYRPYDLISVEGSNSTFRINSKTFTLKSNSLINTLHSKDDFNIKDLNIGHLFFGINFYADVGARIFAIGNAPNYSIFAQFGSIFQIFNPNNYLKNYKFIMMDDMQGLKQISDHLPEQFSDTPQINLFIRYYQSLYREIFSYYPAHPYILLNSFYLINDYILSNISEFTAIMSAQYDIPLLLNKTPEFFKNNMAVFDQLKEISKTIGLFGFDYGFDMETMLYFKRSDLPRPFYTQTRNNLANLIDFLIYKELFLLIEVFVELFLRRTDFKTEKINKSNTLFSLQNEQLNYLSEPLISQEISSLNDYYIFFPKHNTITTTTLEVLPEQIMKESQIITGGFYLIFFEDSQYNSCLVKSNETLFLEKEYNEYLDLFMTYGIPITKRKKIKNIDIQFKKQCDIIVLGIPFIQLKSLVKSLSLKIPQQLYEISLKYWNKLRSKSMETTFRRD